MLRIQGNRKRLCDGITRRDLLHVGGAGLFGLTLPRLLEAQSGLRKANSLLRGDLAASFGRAKRCILLFLYGSPSQLETFDMKPNAPVEIRGTMKPIPSSLPGLDVVEHLPRTARVMDRVTLVRSVTHPYPIHGVAFATTGTPAIDVAMELSPADPRHQPYVGSIIEYLLRKQGALAANSVDNVFLPFPFSSQRSDESHRAGPYAAYLGSAYHPKWTEFVGEGTKSIVKARPGFSFRGKEPYLGCTPASTFRMSNTGILPGMSIDRLDRRRTLLEQFDATRADLERSLAGRPLTQFQQTAFSMLTSPKIAEALDVRREPTATRNLYGMTLFGQSCLAARRLVEAGTRFVSVFWDEYGLAGDAWDTHFNHFPRMIDQLLPNFDLAYSGLILDLERRGMLDDTLVLCLSEHGRTPKLANVAGGGRDHWSRAYSVLFAGGGIARGRVVGSTDEIAGDVKDRPVSPKDLLATAYHLLGIDQRTRLPDRAGRPIGLLADDAEPVAEMIA
ncbi:MAG TPA: DUF1501 domain-containing protein [Planctomycetaceae bacterium]|nr:DUF1501 domain-containing protein [Planctomycetaceae bacterium]